MNAEIDKAISMLKSVLCDAEGRASISGTHEDRAEIDAALSILSALSHGSEQGGEAEPVATYDDQVMWIVRDSLKSFQGKPLINEYEYASMERSIEAAYWIFDAMHKGLGEYKDRPKSERDAFKAVMRLRMEAERTASKITRRAQAAYDKLTAAPTPPAVPDVDERAEFEKWARDGNKFKIEVRCGDGYEDDNSNDAWITWQARARLSNPNANKET